MNDESLLENSREDSTLKMYKKSEMKFGKKKANKSQVHDDSTLSFE
jgi:hypothetical protein